MIITFNFLETYISDNQFWSENTTATVRKAQQRLHYLSVLRKSLEQNYRWLFINEYILAQCITVWYAGCTAADRKARQRVINTAQKKSPAAFCPHWKTLPAPSTSPELQTSN